MFFVFFFQAEDGIRDLVRSHGLGDVYKRQSQASAPQIELVTAMVSGDRQLALAAHERQGRYDGCLLYTSDAADERSSVDLGGRRIIKKKNTDKHTEQQTRTRIHKYHRHHIYKQHRRIIPKHTTI